MLKWSLGVGVVLLGLWAGVGWAEVKWDNRRMCDEKSNCVSVVIGQTTCEQRMETAMRAMERYRERDDAWVTISDATSTITWDGPFTPAPMPMCCDYPLQIDPPPPPPTLEEKIEALEQETTRKIRAMKKAAAEAEEARGQRIVNDAHRKWAYQEWDAVKRECWRQP